VLPTQAFLQITGLYGHARRRRPLLPPARPRPRHLRGARRWIESRGGSYVTVTGRLGAATRIKSLSSMAITGLGVLCGAVALLVLVCYALIAAASLVKGLGADNRLSFVHYAHVFSGGLKAVRDTLIIAVFALPVGGLFAVVLASSSRAPSSRAPRPGVRRHGELRAARAPSSASPTWSPSTTRPSPSRAPPSSSSSATCSATVWRAPAPPWPCSRRSIPRSRRRRRAWAPRP